MKEQMRTTSRTSVGVSPAGRAELRLADARPRPSEKAAPEEGPQAESLRRLARLLAAHAPYDGAFTLRVPGLHVVRRSKPYREMVRATVTPALCIVAQGAKVAMLGREVYSYDASRMIAYAVDLPVAGQIVRASHREPFLALKLELDPYKIAELALRVYPHGVPNPQGSRGVFVGQATTAIVDAASRLVELMADPADAELLAPLAVDEILIRLLRSAIGSRIAQIGQKESGVQRVAKAVTWVRANFAQPMAVEALAALAHMSVSSFHQHFKAVTSMSPLQYQKVLRLQEARRLMLSRMTDAGSAGREVGYLSASQFSREYARLFGSAPTRDIARLRQDGHVMDEASR
jgi:AraC-like DNA-binding protein